MGSIVTRIVNRVYADYLMPSRLNEYERLVKTAIDNGYKHTSLIRFFDELNSADGIAGKKYFVRRHDVDTDIKTAEAMFRIEQRLGVTSSFYFRLSTLDITLMQEMRQSGFEASYHYEEIATAAKKMKLKSRAAVEAQLPMIRERFEHNFTQLTNRLQFRMRSVASHGDFVNRKLGIPNHSLLTDEMRKRLNIELEAYDARLLSAFDVIMSDTDYPQFYKPKNPFDVLTERKDNVVYLLTHPRQWRANMWVNTKDNVQRFTEGLRYGLG